MIVFVVVLKKIEIEILNDNFLGIKNYFQFQVHLIRMFWTFDTINETTWGKRLNFKFFDYIFPVIIHRKVRKSLDYPRFRWPKTEHNLGFFGVSQSEVWKARFFFQNRVRSRFLGLISQNRPLRNVVSSFC